MKKQILRKSLKAILFGCSVSGITSVAMASGEEVIHFSGYVLDHNNEKYIYEKYTENSVDKQRYIAADGRIASSLELLAKPFKPFVSSSVEKLAEYKTPQNGMLELSVLFKTQKLELQTLKKEYVTHREILRNELLVNKNILNDNRIKHLQSELEINKTAYNQQITELKENAFAAFAEKFKTWMHKHGGTIRYIDLASGSAEIKIPATQLDALREIPQLKRVEIAKPGKVNINNIVVTQALRDASPSENLGSFWGNGVLGDPYDVGIIDGITTLVPDTNGSCSSPNNIIGGIQEDHPRLDHVSYFKRPNYINSDPDGHATNVAGIIYSSDARNTGMAFGLEKVYVGDCICNSNPDLVWMMSDAAATGDVPEVVNLSCGAGRFDDNGIREDDTIDISNGGITRDEHIDTYDVILVQAAGNDGEISSVSSIGKDTGYNAISVASADDFNTVGIGDDMLSDFSSRGPSQVLNRKKPDITAVGSVVRTTRANWADPGVNDFMNNDGTSFSAPVVSGFATLLVDQLDLPDALVPKALLINHAIPMSDNFTPGNINDDYILPVGTSNWNSSWGWGYLDSVNALGGSNLQLTSTVAEAGHPNIPAVRFYRSNKNQSVTIKSTLVWNKHKDMGLTDLDLFVYDATNGNETARSYSGVDNVEQVSIAPQDYVLKVEPYTNTLPTDLEFENYALAGVTSSDEKQPPEFDMGFNGSAINPGQTFTWTLSTKNIGQLPAHNTQLQIIAPPGYQVLSPDSINIGTLAPNQMSSSYDFTIQAPCEATSGEIIMRTTSSGYGEVFNTEFTYLINNTPNLSTLALSPRSEGVVPQVYKMPIIEDQWSMASTINRTSNTHLSITMKTDQCSPSILSITNIKSMIYHNWIAINGQQDLEANEAIVYIDANDGFGHSDYYRDQRWHMSQRVKPGESAYQGISLGGDIGLFQIDDLPRGIEIQATAVNSSGYDLDIQKVNGNRTTGSSNFFDHDATAVNQMSVIGTGFSPAMVVSSNDRNLFVGGMELFVSPLKDCAINSTLTDTIYKSNFESNNPQDFVRESSFVRFPDQPTVNNAVTIPHSSLLNVPTVSVEAWVKADHSMSGDGLNFIASKNLNGTGFALFTTGVGNNKRFAFEINAASVTSQTAVEYGKWYHVVGVYTDGNAQIYVNGILENQQVMSGSLLSNENDLTIGSSIFGNNLDWKGDIDEVRLWNRVLSQNEISSNAQACISGFESGLIGYWRFDAPSSMTALDSSNNNLNGNISNVSRIIP